MPSLIGKVLAVRTPQQAPPPVPLADRGTLPGMAFSRASGQAQDAAYLRAYKSQGTVFANVGLLAQSTAKQPWKLFRPDGPDGGGGNRWSMNDQGSDQRPEVTQHAALALLRRPNPFWSRFRLMELSQMWLDLTGKSHWVVGATGGIPTSIWPVRPDRMIPVPDDNSYLRGWVYQAPDGREMIPLDVNQVIYNNLPDPEDPYGGAGGAAAVLDEIDGARYASEWNRNFFANSARPDGVIQVQGTLEDDEWDEMTSRWRESHRGVARAHRVAVLEGGATWQATSTSPKDMDFANLLSTGGDRIREAWGVHKVMTGVTEDVNRANAQTGEEVFSSWQVDSRLMRWRDVYNHQLLPLFGATGQGVEFDYKPAIPPNREEDRLELQAKAAAAQLLVDAGYDPSAVLEVVGLPDMPVAERATQQPALPPGWAAPAPAPDFPSTSPEAAARRHAVWNALERSRG